jgi:hypothetical protein
MKGSADHRSHVNHRAELRLYHLAEASDFTCTVAFTVESTAKADRALVRFGDIPGTDDAFAGNWSIQTLKELPL